MMKSVWVVLAGVAAVGIAFQAGAQSPTQVDLKAPKAKYADVQKVLTANCVMCHSGARARGKIDLTSYANVMKGGEDGVIVVAGKIKSSPLYLAVSHAQGYRPMPPSGTKIADKDVATIESWIKAGAKK